ncbi:hypothetical protein EJ03DRAFT_120440 [Teratosphaeria nubilosa]|uniref:Uncharacterized protein n=1 Tax=Teratosphaeria nubilosa TaxID=161662 RepID=A0A6G1L8B3_9PEZI|nr:hypothetical protein EJ03DRAFT_120440 [Teratosphaeria nubilosa]
MPAVRRLPSSTGVCSSSRQTWLRSHPAIPQYAVIPSCALLFLSRCSSLPNLKLPVSAEAYAASLRPLRSELPLPCLSFRCSFYRRGLHRAAKEGVGALCLVRLATSLSWQHCP